MAIGSISWWSDLNGATPAGYALCDGTANAPGPDLRDRFIICSGSSHTVDTTGGGGVLTHNVTQPSAHTTVAAHTHTQMRFPTATGGSTGYTVDTSMSGTPATTSLETASTGSASVAHSGTAVADHAAYEPAFYVLKLIQRMS